MGETVSLWEDFEGKRKELRLSKAELARRLGVSESAVQLWRQAGVPRYAVAYLELLERLERRDLEVPSEVLEPPEAIE